jgi:hypothetical protein
MKIVHADEVEWKRGLQHRGGAFHYRHLLNGTPGTPGNFQFNVGQLEGDFSSPRHRHNFDQFRFGGASGSGYLSREEVAAGTAELKKYGTFEAGIFRRNDDVEGRRATDGYQAIWEHAHGERMEYPKPRYRDPIMVDPANYEWLPVAGQAGVTHKPLGVFTERQCAAELLRLERGAAYRADGRSVYLVLRGSGIVGDATFRELSAFHLEDGERAELVARDETEILRLVLPDLAGITERRPAQIEAAE